LQVLHQRPTSSLHPVEFIDKVVDLEDELHAGRRPARASVSLVLSTRRTDTDTVPLDGQVRLGILTLIRGEAEPEHAGVEVGCGVEVGGEDLEPHSHRHGHKSLSQNVRPGILLRDGLR